MRLWTVVGGLPPPRGLGSGSYHVVHTGDISSLRRTALSIHLTQDDLTADELVNMIERLVAEEEFKSVEDVCKYYGLSRKWFYSLKKIARHSRVEGVPASTLAVLEGSQLDERRKAEMIEELKVKRLPRSAVVDIVDRLVENPELGVGEVVASYLGSLPHRLDDVTLEAEGKYVYRIRRVQGGVEFMMVRDVSSVDVLLIPLDDLEIVKRLWQQV
mgnify:CR=1 FL=1